MSGGLFRQERASFCSEQEYLSYILLRAGLFNVPGHAGLRVVLDEFKNLSAVVWHLVASLSICDLVVAIVPVESACCELADRGSGDVRE